MLGLIMASKLVWQTGWVIHRYDALFVAALAIQATFLALGMEEVGRGPGHPRLSRGRHGDGDLQGQDGILAYPEPAFFPILGVPLFRLHVCLGRFLHGPRHPHLRHALQPLSAVLADGAVAVSIYANFYLHHYWIDIRWALFAATVLIYRRVWISFTTDRTTLAMPLVVAALLSAFFLWIAENIGTLTGTWVYPGKTGWQMVRLSKFGSWYLLLYVSFVLVTLVLKPEPPDPAGSAGSRTDDADP